MEPVLRKHIENMMERFRTLRPKDSSPVLYSTKSGASSKDSQEIQQFIALCPSDIITLHSTLYPQIFPSGTESRDIKRPLAASSRSFMGGKSPASSAFDMNSVLSRSSSSAVSDGGASIYMPLLERGSIPEDRISLHTSISPAPPGFSGSTSINTTESEEEERFANDLKAAMDTMAGKMSQEELSGKAHPCAENWALLFVSRDGKELSLKIRSEMGHDDEEEDDDAGHESDSDDDGPVEMSALDREYHQLKQAILKLVDEYEILDMREEEERRAKEERNAMYRNNSAPVVTLSGTTPPDTNKNDMSHLDPSNPYRTSNLTAMFADSKKKEAETPRREADTEDIQHSALPKMLQAATQQCIARGDFVPAQQYHRALQQLRRLSPSLARNGYSPLLHYFSMGARDSIDRSARATKQTEAWFVWVSLTQEAQETVINEMTRTMKSLRDKMWYVTDVRNSASFEEAKNVAFALKKMAALPAKTPPRGVKNTRSLSHRASNLSLLKSEGILEVMSAPIEHGGPNKLSDEQSEITKAYLTNFCIENFCMGEERIHRFCHEIDRCVNKIVGDGMLDGPVLWSSELYARDDKELAASRHRADWLMAGVGTLSMVDDGYETDNSQSRWSGPSLLRKPSADFLGRSRAPPVNAHEYNTVRRHRSKSSVGDSMMDRQDLFGMPSPASSTSETQTFWSPFGGNNSSANSRPKTLSSVNSGVIMKQPVEAVSREKRRFLDELKQTLTGLLLSDLGVDLWSKGTETDAWFSGPYVEDCIQRREEQEEKARRREKSRVQAVNKKASKKKSTKNLRKSVNQKGELAVPVETTHGPELSAGEGNSSASDATNISTASSRTAVPSEKKSDLLPFPYMAAFKRLLRRFAINPNPFIKLQILYDLQLLIISSLSSSSPSADFDRRISLPTSPLFQQLTGEQSRVSNHHLRDPTNLEQAIQNVEERRSCAIGKSSARQDSNGTPVRPRSPDNNIPNTDKIVEVLQDLFRQADVRPKTLFRDLQYVAAFVPASVLDMTELGKAFWDTGLAALGLKQDVKKTMVEMADEIVGYQAKQRNADRSANTEGSEFFQRYTLKDAAQMLMITAKEGNEAAQRELAIFYLTNPGDLPRIVKPLSKPKDTFRPQLMNTRGEDLEKRDPATMCTAYHWMELSAEGGDSLAKQYIKQRDREESW